MSGPPEWRVWAAGAGGLVAGVALGCAIARRPGQLLRLDGGDMAGRAIIAQSVWAAGASGLVAGLALGCAVVGQHLHASLGLPANGVGEAEMSETKAAKEDSKEEDQPEELDGVGSAGTAEEPEASQQRLAAAKARAQGELADLLGIFHQLPVVPLARGGGKTPAHSGARAVLAVASGKGGVGKSTVAVNLAYALRKLGLRVGLVDIDIHGPSLPELIPMPPDSVNTADGLIVPLYYDGVCVMSWGYIQPRIAATIRAPIATRCTTELLQNVRWGELDVLLVDTPPGTGDVLLTLTQTLRLDGAVLVTTGNEMSIADLEKGAQMFEKVDVPTLAMCQNMASVACKSCGAEHDLFSDEAHARIPRLIEAYPEAQLHKIPLDTLLSVAPTRPCPPRAHAYPFIRNPNHDDRPASRALHGLAEGLLAALLATRSRHGRHSELRLRPNGPPELRLPGGELRQVSAAELRAACRCAECVDELTGKPILDREKVLQDSTLCATSAVPVGNYGVRVKFSDGHSSLLALRMIERLVGESGQRPAKESW